MQNEFAIIVPVYNSEKWIGKCLESIVSQNYNHYDLLVIDDHSTDHTWDIIKSYNVYAIRNKERQGALANIVKGIDFIGRDIIVTVDGDDYLADNKVFSHLNEVYISGVWMTYGSFLPVSGKYNNTCQSFDHITTPETYRKSGLWVTSHLRTFKKCLWDYIETEDLQDEDGEYYKVAWDMAFMYPMIEMAGDHVKFIDRILYIYNDLNPNCDGTLNPDLQVKTGKKIQGKKEYARIDGDIL